MVSPGDNMAQTEPLEPHEEEESWLTEECKNCEHQRQDHFDRAGCKVKEPINLHAAATAYPRCHCTNFEVKE